MLSQARPQHCLPYSTQPTSYHGPWGAGGPSTKCGRPLRCTLIACWARARLPVCLKLEAAHAKKQQQQVLWTTTIAHRRKHTFSLGDKTQSTDALSNQRSTEQPCAEHRLALPTSCATKLEAPTSLYTTQRFDELNRQQPQWYAVPRSQSLYRPHLVSHMQERHVARARPAAHVGEYHD